MYVPVVYTYIFHITQANAEWMSGIAGSVIRRGPKHSYEACFRERCCIHRCWLCARDICNENNAQGFLYSYSTWLLINLKSMTELELHLGYRFTKKQGQLPLLHLSSFILGISQLLPLLSSWLQPKAWNSGFRWSHFASALRN